MLDSGHAHAQIVADLFVREPTADPLKHFGFAPCQREIRIRRRAAAFFLAKQGAQEAARNVGRTGEAARDNVRERCAKAVDR